MAKRFLTPINLTNLSSDPATGSEGDLYFNTTENVVKIYADSAWTELTGGAGGGASVIFTPDQPDVTNLEVGTIWVDSNASATGGGGGGGGGTGGPSFQTIVTNPSTQSIVAATAGETLTIISGENISITNASANNSITINSTGNYTSVDSISYPDYIVFDTTPENTSASTGTLFWDDGEGTLDLILNENIDIGLSQEIIIKCFNGEGTTLNKGEVVMVSGAQGERPRVIRAYNTSDAGSARTFGLVAESIASGGEGFVVTQGIIKGINTNSFEAGDPLYLSATPGQLTTVKPQAPNHYVWVGVVLKKNASSGRIYVKPQNGYELDEIHDVRIVSEQDGDLIVYNSASSLWVNSPKQNIINTASAAAYASASAYTDQQIATIDLSSTIQTASAAAVSYLVDGAPAALDTLNELSAALNDNANILDTLLTTTAASSTYLSKTASAAFTRWTKTLSASATVISGVDDNSITLQYNPSYEQVFINGVLIANNEYTATSGSAIVLTEAAVVNDVIDIYAYQNSTNVNTYSQAQIDAKYNNLTRWKKVYTIPGNESFTVTNNGSGAYVVAGVQNPTFNLVKGNTYTFSINASGHPFWIQTVSGGYSSGNVYSTGTTNLGTDNGTITWTVPTNAPDTLYYACQYHSSMKGTINLLDPAKVQGNDDNSIPLSYTSGYEQVYLNGILLTPITDYARTSASIITLGSGVVTNDVIEIINTQPFNVADVYTTSQANSTFLTQASASSTYLTQTSASTTYLTQSGASAIYAAKPLGVVGYIGATGAATFTANTATTILTLTPTITAGRLYKATGNAAFQNPNATGSRALFFEETSQSLRRTLRYDTVTQNSNAPWGMNGSIYFTAAEVGVTSGTATKTCLLRFQTNASGVYLVTNPDAIVGVGSLPQQFIIEDIGAS